MAEAPQVDTSQYSSPVNNMQRMGQAVRSNRIGDSDSGQGSTPETKPTKAKAEGSTKADRKAKVDKSDDNIPDKTKAAAEDKVPADKAADKTATKAESPADDSTGKDKEAATDKGEGFDFRKSLLGDREVEVPDSKGTSPEDNYLHYTANDIVMTKSGEKKELSKIMEENESHKALREVGNHAAAYMQALGETLAGSMTKPPTPEELNSRDDEVRAAAMEKKALYDSEYRQGAEVMQQLEARFGQLLQAGEKIKEQERDKAIKDTYKSLTTEIPELLDDEFFNDQFKGMVRVGVEIGGLTPDEASKHFGVHPGIAKIFMAAHNWMLDQEVETKATENVKKRKASAKPQKSAAKSGPTHSNPMIRMGQIARQNRI